MVLVPATCQSFSRARRERFGVQMKLPAKECPVSKSLRPRSPARFLESGAAGKLYWIVPPVFELSSSDFAYVYAARTNICRPKRRRTVTAPELYMEFEQSQVMLIVLKPGMGRVLRSACSRPGWFM